MLEEITEVITYKYSQVFVCCLLFAFVVPQGERIDKTRGMSQKGYKTLIAFLVEITTVSVAVTASGRTVGSSACSLTTLLYLALQWLHSRELRKWEQQVQGRRRI